jgi:hypothetical protein
MKKYEAWRKHGKIAIDDASPGDVIYDLGRGVYQRSNGTMYFKNGNFTMGTDGTHYFDYGFASSDGSIRVGDFSINGMGSLFNGVNPSNPNDDTE